MKSVGAKFALVVASAALVILLVFSCFEVVSQVYEKNRDEQNKMDWFSDVVEVSFSQALWNMDKDSVRTIADGFFKDEDVAYLSITDEFGANFYNRSNKGQAYSKDYIIEKRIDIIYKDDKIGEATIGITHYFKGQELRMMIAGKILNMIIVAIVLILVVSITSFIITKPINTLKHGAEEIAAGNLSRQIKVNGKDEIAQLAEKFNFMSVKLNEMMQEREQAMIALAASEEKFSKAFQYSSDIIGIVVLEGEKYLDVSDSFFEVFGYSREEVIGHSSGDFGLWCNTEQRNELYEIMQRDGFHHKTEVCWKTKSGEIRTGLSSTKTINIGNQQCNLFIWHDITDRKCMEEALRQANEELEAKVEERTQELMAANEELQAINEELLSTLETLRSTQVQLIQSEKLAALGNLVAGVAHEINTPIGVSLTAATYMESIAEKFEQLYSTNQAGHEDLEKFITKSKETASIIYNNLDRAAKLIRSFKQVSVDQSSEDKRKFVIKQYLEELLISLHPKLKKTRHQVILDCDEELEIDSYPGSLAQIITNLIMNSLIHAYEQDDQGQIRITVKQAKQQLILTYEDNGKGMEKSVRDRIFEPFFTTKRGQGGTGLGLHIIYNIVTMQLGGQITCESEPGLGARFVIQFPL